MKCMQSNNPRVAVIGAGAAGLVAAGTALSLGACVTMFDGNQKVGRKLMITGKGRCNVTNDATVPAFLENVPTNPRFLYKALATFSPQDTMALMERLGVPLKVERGRRVFPVSDKAVDIVDALKKYTAEADFISEKVTDILVSDGFAVGVVTDAREYAFDAVIMATGGLSYPLTGSDGSGFSIVKKLGHTVTPLLPSLVPLECSGSIHRDLQGLSLRNIGFTVRHRESGKTVYKDFGEMMFTHFGITGPLVLSASSHLPKTALADYDAVIDLKPALDEKTLDARLLSDFAKYKNKDYLNALSDLLPQKLILPIVTLSGIDPRKKVNAVTKEERHRLLFLLKGFSLPLLRPRPIAEAIVTSGGVSVKEIDPSTMMSKKVPHLFFAGEMIDVDAYTGGYNLQIAFSTGYLAAESAVALLKG